MNIIITILLVFTPVILISQKIELDKKPKIAAKELFELSVKEDVVIVHWLFDFACPDSSLLVNLMSFIAEDLNLEIVKVSYEEDASIKYPSAFVCETVDYSTYTTHSME